VVDNASTDGSVEAIQREFPDVKLLVNEVNKGFGAANNQALRLARGEFFLLLNSDAFPRSQAIERLLECASSHPRAAVVGPRLLNGDGSLQFSCYRFPSPLKSVWENCLLAAALPDHPVFGDFRNWEHDEEREVDFVIGACWLVRREAAEEVGFFDEEFFLYSEETDWAKRFWAAGWSVLFTPAAEVVHLGGGSGQTQADRVFNEFHRAQERFMRKHYGKTGLMVYRATTIFGACVRIVLFLVAALCRVRQRRDYLRQVSQWKRILLWILGKRGPGLQETA
jgi:GT2 family glycosyltransferase